MKADRLKETIMEFAAKGGEDRKGLVLCYDANVALALATRGHDMIEGAPELKGVLAHDDTPLCITCRNGKLYFSDNPDVAGHDADDVWFDDRIEAVMNRVERAQENMSPKAAGKVKLGKGTPASQKMTKSEDEDPDEAGPPA